MLQSARARRGNDSFTKLLLHMDGADTSTSFPDSSPNGYTVTAVGNAQVDTAQSKFGGASALFDGTGDKLQIADDAALELGTSDFTIEFWMRPNSLSGSNMVVFAKRINNGANGGPVLIYTRSTTLLSLGLSGASAFSIVANSDFGTIATGNWYHVALTRSGSTFTKWLNGVSGGTVTSSASLENNSSPWNIGDDDPDGFGAVPFNGWIDEFRMSIGVARYTAAFTPPKLPFSRGGKASAPSFAMA